jgi:hypothetical protein
MGVDSSEMGASVKVGSKDAVGVYKGVGVEVRDREADGSTVGVLLEVNVVRGLELLVALWGMDVTGWQATLVAKRASKRYRGILRLILLLLFLILCRNLVGDDTRPLKFVPL